MQRHGTFSRGDYKSGVRSGKQVWRHKRTTEKKQVWRPKKRTEKKQVWRAKKDRLTILTPSLFEHIMSFLVGDCRDVPRRLPFLKTGDSAQGGEAGAPHDAGDSKGDTKSKRVTVKWTNYLAINFLEFGAIAGVSTCFRRFAHKHVSHVRPLKSLVDESQIDLRVRHHLISNGVCPREWKELHFRSGSNGSEKIEIIVIDNDAATGTIFLRIKCQLDLNPFSGYDHREIPEYETFAEGKLSWKSDTGALEVIKPEALHPLDPSEPEFKATRCYLRKIACEFAFAISCDDDGKFPRLRSHGDKSLSGFSKIPPMSEETLRVLSGGPKPRKQFPAYANLFGLRTYRHVCENERWAVSWLV